MQTEGNVFGNTIYRRRKALGLTQEALAEKVGVKPTYIGYLERGKRHASPRIAGALAEHLSLNKAYLFLLSEPHVREFLNVSDEAYEIQGEPLPQSLLDLEGDTALRLAHHIGDEEMTVLKRCAFLGETTGKQDWVFFWETIQRIFRTDSAPQGRGPRC